MKLRDWNQPAPYEIRVLELIAEGLSNKEIAERLRVKEKTVKNYTERIYTKLSVNNRVKAILVGKERGWLK